ncbi:MAG: hypothetical protein ABSG66_12545, partial [Stellaceae bacterium]
MGPVIQEQQQITRLQRVLCRSASAQSQRKGAAAPRSWTPQESEVERREHQDDSNIHCQPFPESVSEEHEIYTDYDGCHRHHVKHHSYLSAHFRSSLVLKIAPHAIAIATIFRAVMFGQVLFLAHDLPVEQSSAGDHEEQENPIRKDQ